MPVVVVVVVPVCSCVWCVVMFTGKQLSVRKIAELELVTKQKNLKYRTTKKKKIL